MGKQSLWFWTTDYLNRVKITKYNSIMSVKITDSKSKWIKAGYQNNYLFLIYEESELKTLELLEYSGRSIRYLLFTNVQIYPSHIQTSKLFAMTTPDIKWKYQTN